MTQSNQSMDHLSPYERAVCYYSLPHVISPLTYGIIIAYTVCVVEALVALVIGVLLDHKMWINVGVGALVALVVFGIVIFTARAFLNEFRQRRFLKEARNAMSADNLSADSGSDPDGIPDPFEAHRLFWCNCYHATQIFERSNTDEKVCYLVDNWKQSFRWKVMEAGGDDLFSIIGSGRPHSFLYGNGLPAQIDVLKDNKIIAHIRQRFNIKTPYTEILDTEKPDSHIQYHIRRDGIYCDGALVGRIYNLKGNSYLDIHSDSFSCGILAYFVSCKC